MKKPTLFLIANSKINKRFRKGEDFIMGCAGLGSSALAIARHNANKSDLYTCPIASFHSFIFSSCRL